VAGGAVKDFDAVTIAVTSSPVLTVQPSLRDRAGLQNVHVSGARFQTIQKHAKHWLAHAIEARHAIIAARVGARAQCQGSAISSGRVNKSLSLSAVAPCGMSLAPSSNLRSFAGFVHHHGPAFSFISEAVLVPIATAALELGATYDPTMLQHTDIADVRGGALWPICRRHGSWAFLRAPGDVILDANGGVEEGVCGGSRGSHHGRSNTP
jgi:hypothetical protein